MLKITPFLWFDTQAEEAMNYYVSVFPDSRMINISRAAGKVMGVTAELSGQKVMALNGGPQFHFTEAISMFVDCETQAEVDALWDTFTTDGTPGECGWLKDKFGLSWQIVPQALGRLMGDKDPVKAKRVLEAMLKMKKLDANELQAAYDHA